MTESRIEQPSADEKLKDIFRRLMELYERHAQERQWIVKEKEEMSELIHLLVTQTKEIGQYENGIRKRIQDCIKESANQAMNGIELAILEKTNQSIDNTVNTLNEICQSTKENIELYRNEKDKFSWKIIITAIISGVLSSVLITWILMPKPVLPLTAEQISYLREGQMLVKMWPKLTKKEKDRLKVVSYEIMNAK